MHDHEGRVIPAKLNRRALIELTALSAIVPAFSSPLAEEEPAKKFRVDPDWPRPLPTDAGPGHRREWITGEVAGSAVDANDNVWIVSRRNLTATELLAGAPSPAVMAFNPKGEVIQTWPERGSALEAGLPNGLHGIFVDYQGFVWIAGNADAFVQKYTQDGHLVMQIGTKGQFDSSDGTAAGTPLNTSHTKLNRPSDVAVDPTNGDVYISDGYGNHRVVVFDRNGNYLRQWGEAGTLAEAQAGAPAKFRGTVHGVNIGADALVYVNDRAGDRIQVFMKNGTFVRNIWTSNGIPIGQGSAGSAWDLAFSADKRQTFIYSTDGDQQITSTIDHSSGDTVARMGRSGHMAGEFTFLHTITVDSKGTLYTAETIGGRRVQKFHKD
jgi:DNA-binding beta-propeller fold protein YncE